MRQRRKTALRKVEPRKLDAQVVLFSYIQSDAHWSQWRRRMVTLRTAARMVADGEAIVITRRLSGELLTMYRESKPLKPSLPSPAMLTMATTNAVAVNQGGYRLTRGEQAHVDKFTLWPFDAVRSDGKPAIRTVTIRPRVGDYERKAAEAVLRRAHGVKREIRTKVRIQAAQYDQVSVAA